MKTTVLLVLSTLWRSPKKRFLTLLFILCVWPGASTAQAATADAVVAWGAGRSNPESNPVFPDYGQSLVPVAA